MNKIKLVLPLALPGIKTGIFSLFTALLFLPSCEYDTDQVYNRTVDKNTTAPVIGMVELHLEGDTVYVYGSTDFNFSFTSSDQEIIGAGFSVDGADSLFVQSDNGQFRYRTAYLTPGQHTLKLDLYTHSGSSSIADILNYESYQFSKTWVLILVNDYYTYYEENVSNGYLKLIFPKYRNPDLTEYVISRFIIDSFREVGRVTIPEFTDSTYVGEGGSYRVQVNTSSGDRISWGEANLNSDLPQVRYYNIPGSGNFVTWDRSKFFNAASGYYAEITNMNNNLGAIPTKLNSSADTILSLTGFQNGEVGLIKLRVVPKKGNLVYTVGYYPSFERYQYFTVTN